MFYTNKTEPETVCDHIIKGRPQDYEIENVHETIFALKTALAIAEYVRDNEKTEHLEIDNVIYAQSDGNRYIITVEKIESKGM